MAASSRELLAELQAQEAPAQDQTSSREVLADIRANPAPANYNRNPESSNNTFETGIARGAGNVQTLVGQTANFLGENADVPALEQWGEAGIRRGLVQAMMNPAEVEFKDIDDFAKFGTWALGLAGEQVPMMGTLMAGGAAGLGAGLSLRTVAGVGKSFANRMAAAGAYSAGWTLGTGEVLQELTDAGIDPEFWPTVAGGATIAALDVLSFGRGLSMAFPKGTSAGIATSFSGTVAKSFGYGSITQFATEASTEAMQELAVLASRKYQDPTYEIFTEENILRMAEAGVGGGLVGAGMGGPTAAFGGGTRYLADAARRGKETKIIKEGVAAAEEIIRGAMPPGTFWADNPDQNDPDGDGGGAGKVFMVDEEGNTVEVQRDTFDFTPAEQKLREVFDRVTAALGRNKEARESTDPNVKEMENDTAIAAQGMFARLKSMMEEAGMDIALAKAILYEMDQRLEAGLNTMTGQIDNMSEQRADPKDRADAYARGQRAASRVEQIVEEDPATAIKELAQLIQDVRDGRATVSGAELRRLQKKTRAKLAQEFRKKKEVLRETEEKYMAMADEASAFEEQMPEANAPQGNDTASEPDVAAERAIASVRDGSRKAAHVTRQQAGRFGKGLKVILNSKTLPGKVILTKAEDYEYVRALVDQGRVGEALGYPTEKPDGTTGEVVSVNTRRDGGEVQGVATDADNFEATVEQAQELGDEVEVVNVAEDIDNRIKRTLQSLKTTFRNLTTTTAQTVRNLFFAYNEYGTASAIPAGLVVSVNKEHKYNPGDLQVVMLREEVEVRSKEKVENLPEWAQPTESKKRTELRTREVVVKVDQNGKQTLVKDLSPDDVMTWDQLGRKYPAIQELMEAATSDISLMEEMIKFFQGDFVTPEAALDYVETDPLNGGKPKTVDGTTTQNLAAARVVWTLKRPLDENGNPKDKGGTLVPTDIPVDADGRSYVPDRFGTYGADNPKFGNRTQDERMADEAQKRNDSDEYPGEWVVETMERSDGTPIPVLVQIFNDFESAKLESLKLKMKNKVDKTNPNSKEGIRFLLPVKNQDGKDVFLHLATLVEIGRFLNLNNSNQSSLHNVLQTELNLHAGLAWYLESEGFTLAEDFTVGDTGQYSLAYKNKEIWPQMTLKRLSENRALLVELTALYTDLTANTHTAANVVARLANRANAMKDAGFDKATIDEAWRKVKQAKKHLEKLKDPSEYARRVDLSGKNTRKEMRDFVQSMLKTYDLVNPQFMSYDGTSAIFGENEYYEYDPQISELIADTISKQGMDVFDGPNQASQAAAAVEVWTQDTRDNPIKEDVTYFDPMTNEEYDRLHEHRSRFEGREQGGFGEPAPDRRGNPVPSVRDTIFNDKDSGERRQILNKIRPGEPIVTKAMLDAAKARIQSAANKTGDKAIVDAHRERYRALKEMYDSQQTTDAFTLAAEAVLKRFGVKEPLLLIDEESGLDMIAELRRIAAAERAVLGDKTNSKSYFTSLDRIEALEGQANHIQQRLNFMHQGKTINGYYVTDTDFGRHQFHVIIISSDPQRNVPPNRVLVHELGHLIHANLLTKLPADLRRELFNTFEPTNTDAHAEAFAEAFAYWFSHQYQRTDSQKFSMEKLVRAHSLGAFFEQVVAAMQEVWNWANHSYGAYTETFDDFMTALGYNVGDQKSTGEVRRTKNKVLVHEAWVRLRAEREKFKALSSEPRASGLRRSISQAKLSLAQVEKKIAYRDQVAERLRVAQQELDALLNRPQPSDKRKQLALELEVRQARSKLGRVQKTQNTLENTKGGTKYADLLSERGRLSHLITEGEKSLAAGIVGQTSASEREASENTFIDVLYQEAKAKGLVGVNFAEFRELMKNKPPMPSQREMYTYRISRVGALNTGYTPKDFQKTIKADKYFYGELPADVDGAGAAYNDRLTPARRTYWDRVRAWAYKMLRDGTVTRPVTVADAELRAMGPVGVWIAQQFHARPGEQSIAETIFSATNRLAGPMYAKLIPILEGLPGQHKSTWGNDVLKKPFDAMKEELHDKGIGPGAFNPQERVVYEGLLEALIYQKPLSEMPLNVRNHAEKIRTYLDYLHKWATDNGVRMNYAENYFPFMFNIERVQENKGDFIQVLRQHGYTLQAAEEVYIGLIESRAGGLYSISTEVEEGQLFGPAFDFANQRRWPPELRADLASFGMYREDVSSVLSLYTDSLVRQVAWAQRFKETDLSAKNRQRYEDAGVEIYDVIGKLKLQLAEGLRSGMLRQADHDRIVQKIIPAYQGKLGLDINPTLKNINSAMIPLQNMAILGLALLSSFVDVGTMAYRSKSIGGGAAFRNMAKAWNNKELARAANLLGLIRHGTADNILNDQAMNVYTGGMAKRMNDWFFRLNLMEGWTNWTRTASMITAVEFMNHHALEARRGNAESAYYLRELNITPDEILNWNGLDMSNPRIGAAIHRFVDSAVVRPDASIRPVWGSDPSWAMVFHLKSFVFGYHETFLRRVAEDTKNLPAGAGKLAPILMLGLFTLPLAAAGYEIRKLLQGKESGPGDDMMGYTYEVAQRSGIFGVLQLFMDMEAAGDYDKPFFMGIAGPSAETAWDVATQGPAQWLPQMVPGRQIVPFLEDGVRALID